MEQPWNDFKLLRTILPTFCQLTNQLSTNDEACLKTPPRLYEALYQELDELQSVLEGYEQKSRNTALEPQSPETLNIRKLLRRLERTLPSSLKDGAIEHTPYPRLNKLQNDLSAKIEDIAHRATSQSTTSKLIKSARACSKSLRSGDRRTENEPLETPPILFTQLLNRPLIACSQIRKHAELAFEILQKYWACCCETSHTKAHLHLATSGCRCEIDKIQCTCEDTCFELLLSSPRHGWLRSRIEIGDNRTGVRFAGAEASCDAGTSVEDTWELVRSVCNLIQTTSDKQRSFVFRVKNKKLWYRLETQHSSVALADKTLADIITSRHISHSRKDRFILAVLLARAVVNLQGSVWSVRPWETRQIYFHQGLDAPDFWKPYLSSSIESSPIRGYASTVRSLESLGYFLYSLESGQHVDLDTLQNVQDQLYDEIGTAYKPYIDAADACIRTAFKTSLADARFDNESFIQELYQVIVCPLEKALYGSFPKLSPTTIFQNQPPCETLSLVPDTKKDSFACQWDEKAAKRKHDQAFTADKSSHPCQGSIENIVNTRETGRLRHEDYHIGWICPMAIERAAAEAMLDEKHESLSNSGFDHNVYSLGRIGKHNIVIATPPITGTTSTAIVAKDMKYTFRALRAVLLVGIGGGAPSKKNDIRLGDIVVSAPDGTYGGVVQVDFGKSVPKTAQNPTGFQLTGALDRPSGLLLGAARAVQSRHLGLSENEAPGYVDYLSTAIKSKPRMRAAYPGVDQDQLYSPFYDHRSDHQTCEHCDPKMLVKRVPRALQEPTVHFGLIASANNVQKHGRARATIARSLNVLCFEMEAAGVMDTIPSLVIRGICDYSDSHKNKRWQPYAALAAAAYAKEVLLTLPEVEVAASRPVSTEAQRESTVDEMSSNYYR